MSTYEWRQTRVGRRYVRTNDGTKPKAPKAMAIVADTPDFVAKIEPVAVEPAPAVLEEAPVAVPTTPKAAPKKTTTRKRKSSTKKKSDA